MGLDISGAFVAAAGDAASSGTEDPDACPCRSAVGSALVLVGETDAGKPGAESDRDPVSCTMGEVVSPGDEVVGALVRGDVGDAVSASATESAWNSPPSPAHNSSHELLELNI